MKFSCLKQNLNPVIQMMSRIVSTRPTLPVLNNVLIQASDKQLTLAATNLEIGLHSNVPAKVETDGAFTVPAKLLADFIHSLPEDKIDFELEGNLLSVFSGRYQATFNGIDAEEFPANPALKGGDSTTIKASDLVTHLPLVTFAAAADEARPVITGVLVLLDGKQMTLVSADGYRLAEKVITLSEDSEKISRRLIVPARSLTELQRLLSDGDGEAVVEVAYDDNQIIFRYQALELVSRLLVGQYPDYKQIIPTSYKTEVLLDRQELQQAMRIGVLFARDSASVVNLKVDVKGGKFQINAASAQVGENQTELPAEASGEDAETAYNARYILDFLGVVESPKVLFKLNDPLGPGVLVPATEVGADTSYHYVVMPIRT